MLSQGETQQDEEMSSQETSVENSVEMLSLERTQQDVEMVSQEDQVEMEHSGSDYGYGKRLCVECINCKQETSLLEDRDQYSGCTYILCTMYCVYSGRP